MDFQRVNWRKQALALPGSWYRSNEDVWAICPNGHSAVLDHEIADDGKVTPSLDCPADRCNFHEFVRLVDWEPAEIGDD